MIMTIITENDKDKELKKELDKIDWGKYIQYGNIKINIQKGKRETIAIERSYRD